MFYKNKVTFFIILCALQPFYIIPRNAEEVRRRQTSHLHQNATELPPLVLITSVENPRILLFKGSVTDMKYAQALVNPANRWLNHAGGIAGVLAKAAGPKLQGHSTHIIYETFKNKLEI